jgi:KDO2-lipid IV(A) lauroyltransferase
MLVHTWPAKRGIVARHLRRASSGGLNGSELDAAVAALFENYGRYWYELFRLPGTTPGQLDAHFDIEGFEHVEAAHAAGRGAILALPHVGNWDYAGAWLAARGYPPTVVVEAIDPPELFSWFRDTRRRLGMDVVPLGPGAGTVVGSALRAGHIVCLLGDRDLTGHGVEVDFFGEVTRLPEGPALFAFRTGAPLLPVACYFTADGGHLTRVLPPLEATRRGRLRDDVADLTRALAGRFEDLIRVAPEQWLNMSPTWPSDRSFS